MPVVGRTDGHADGRTDDGEITPKEEGDFLPFASLPLSFPYDRREGGRTRARALLSAPSLPPSVDSAIRSQSDSDARHTPETELQRPTGLRSGEEGKIHVNFDFPFWRIRLLRSVSVI